MSTFQDAYAALAEAATQTDATVKRPRRLAVSGIKTAPLVFQCREGEADGGDVDPTHVRTLCRALSTMSAEKVFDPITVMMIGEDAFVVDGHHRLGAYKAAKVTKPVPVEWFAGSLADAVAEAACRNRKTRLPMSPSERQEAAWRLVVLNKHSKRRAAESAGVSERTVARMRATLRDFRTRWPHQPPGTFSGTVRQLRLADNKDRDETHGNDDWRRAQIARFAHGLTKQFGPHAYRNPDYFAEGLITYGGEEWAARLVEELKEGQITDDDLENTVF